MGRAHFMNPHRLCAAADSLLEAMGFCEAGWPGGDDRKNGDGRTRIFTQSEINEAALMLARMGFLRSDASPSA